MSGSNWYDTAQICKNGHLINGFSHSDPTSNKKFCPTCGAETETICKVCNTPIQGYLHFADLGPIGDYTIPKYCQNCGTAYTWTELKLQAAKKIVDLLDELEPSERDELKVALDDIAKDTPDAEPSAYKFKKIMTKISSDAKSLVRDLIIDIASEAIVKIIMPERS